MPSSYYTTFVFKRKFRSSIFFLWLVGCCTSDCRREPLTGWSPTRGTTTGATTAPSRSSAARSVVKEVVVLVVLQDPPRQGHFKHFQSKLRLDKDYFVLQQDLQDLQDPPGQGHFKDFDRNDSWRTLFKWLLPFFNQCFELICRHSFVGFQQDGQDGSLTRLNRV